MKTDAATLKRVYAMSLAGVYPHYVAKAEKKGRTKAEVDEIIRWLTGYTQKQLESILEERTDIETFIAKARLNPARTLASAVPAQVWQGIWIYFTAPPLAMRAAAECYLLVRGSRHVFCAKLHYQTTRRRIFCQSRRTAGSANERAKAFREHEFADVGGGRLPRMLDTDE